MMKNELTKLIIESDYVECYKWVDDMFLIWVRHIWWDNFIDELGQMFGNSLFDEGGFDAKIQEDYICLDLVDILGGYINIKEVFPYDEVCLGESGY